jgi:hypothetical protein
VWKGVHVYPNTSGGCAPVTKYSPVDMANIAVSLVTKGNVSNGEQIAIVCTMEFYLDPYATQNVEYYYAMCR